MTKENEWWHWKTTFLCVFSFPSCWGFALPFAFFFLGFTLRRNKKEEEKMMRGIWDKRQTYMRKEGGVGIDETRGRHKKAISAGEFRIHISALQINFSLHWSVWQPASRPRHNRLLSATLTGVQVFHQINYKLQRRMDVLGVSVRPYNALDIKVK